MIFSEVPGTSVQGGYGRQSAFEIKINGKLVYSKLQKGSFPNFKAIVDQVVHEYKSSN